MKIILRDDDTCFYTDPNELEQAFADIPDVPISLSIIPFAAYEHRGTFPFASKNKLSGYPDIALNQQLVSYLKEKLATGKFSILLHAINHEYRILQNNEWETEMQYLSPEEILRGIASGKRHLEQIFDTDIRTFIGPSNDITAQCAIALEKLGLNTNYVVYKKFNRCASIHNLLNYLFCNVYRVVTNHRYSGVLRYQNHCEVSSHPFIDLEKAKYQYQICKKANHPLVLYTHYWSLNSNPKEKEDFTDFIKWAIDDGAEFLPMDHIWS